MEENAEAGSVNGSVNPEGERHSSPTPSTDQQQAGLKLIKLISVRLKEAALDSPSFRANVNYYNSQVDHTDQWIDGLIKFLKKYPQQISDFKEFNSVLSNQLLPDFLGGGLVDQESTISILAKAKRDLDTMWGDSMKQLNFRIFEANEILSNLSKIHIKHFKEIKKNFEFIQSKYDSLLNKYNSQAKNKEPSASREDAFQLFEVRKSYLNASLDMCLEISKFHDILSTNLIQLTELIFKDKTNFDQDYFSKVTSWSAAITKSVNYLLDDMIRSKEQIEKVTVKEFEPSRDLKQHNPALINPSTLIQYDPEIDGEIEDLAFEKHGWLWMKTNVGKPSRQIWVRRWVFVKSGIFGLFSLSPSKHFVQETDKIGVLLCNIRYAPDEDRRFCFEIKTIDLSIIFQAETLKELRSWLKVFTLEKQRAIENSNQESGKFAFSRYPPLLYEFANTSLTSIDSELTSSRYDNTTTDDKPFIISSTHLSDLINKDPAIDDGEPLIIDLKGNHLTTPIITSRSKIALISHEFLQPTIVPTAITANIWGIVNWGVYYMSGSPETINENQKTNERNQKHFPSLNTNETYPSNYPASLKEQDIELRCLFDTAIDKNELLVISFCCLWSLNPTQELSGRCFITNKFIYFYLNSAGFVSLLKKSLTEIVAVEAVSEKNWDVLKVYDLEGLSMKGRVFLDDTKIIQKKINFLINDLAKEKPSEFVDILKHIEKIETNEKKLLKINNKEMKDHKDKIHNQRFELNSIQPYEGQILGDKSLKTNYKNEFQNVTIHSFNVPAKALFHLLYGDHSSVLRDSLSFLDVEQFLPGPWYDDNGELVRYINLKIAVSSLNRKDVNIVSTMEQRIEEMIENKYYRIEERRHNFRFLWSGTFRVTKKIIIIEQDSKSSKLYVYVKVTDDSKSHSLLYKIFKRTILHFQFNEINLSISKLQNLSDELGQHGKIIKAIRNFGNLSKTNEKFEKKDDVVYSFRTSLVIRYYLRAFFYQVSSLLFMVSRVSLITFFHLWRMITSHRLLLLILLISILSNVFLIGKTSMSFWQAVRIEKMLTKFRNGIELNKVERSISLHELELLSNNKLNTSSQCFENFINLEGGTSDKETLSITLKYRESKHQIAVKRNELLVELKILERIEKELTLGNYRNFLLSELNSCRIAIEELKVADSSLKEYCLTCNEEYEKIVNGLL